MRRHDLMVRSSQMHTAGCHRYREGGEGSGAAVESQLPTQRPQDRGQGPPGAQFAHLQEHQACTHDLRPLASDTQGHPPMPVLLKGWWDLGAPCHPASCPRPLSIPRAMRPKSSPRSSSQVSSRPSSHFHQLQQEPQGHQAGAPPHSPPPPPPPPLPPPPPRS